MDMEKLLSEEKIKLEKQIAKLNSRLNIRCTPDERKRLACTSCRGTSQYYLDGKYISKNDLKEVKQIAQSEYDTKILKELIKKLSYINKLLIYCEADPTESIYDKLCAARKEIIIPIEEPKDNIIKKWKEESYEVYNRWDDVKTEFYTSDGIRVRSKSELLIADELTRYGVPYKYECPLELFDGGQKKVFRPDFKALNCRTCKEFILEHLGMMDNTGYYNTNLKKLDIYERNGYLLGVNLLIFHETSDTPLNISAVRKYIEEYLI